MRRRPELRVFSRKRKRKSVPSSCSNPTRGINYRPVKLRTKITEPTSDSERKMGKTPNRASRRISSQLDQLIVVVGLVLLSLMLSLLFVGATRAADKAPNHPIQEEDEAVAAKKHAAQSSRGDWPPPPPASTVAGILAGSNNNNDEPKTGKSSELSPRFDLARCRAVEFIIRLLARPKTRPE